MGGDNNSTNADDSLDPGPAARDFDDTCEAREHRLVRRVRRGADRAPPGAGRCGYGPRLPFLVLSPWSKTNFIDHTVIDQTSSLRFIEENWNLGSVDGTTLPAGQPLGTTRSTRSRARS